VSIALLELTCDRYLDTRENAVDAFELIEKALQRAVQRRNASLQ
jgi:hypothetical protein